MLAELRNDSFAVVSQTITAWVNCSKSGKSSHFLSKVISQMLCRGISLFILKEHESVYFWNVQSWRKSLDIDCKHFT